MQLIYYFHLAITAVIAQIKRLQTGHFSGIAIWPVQDCYEQELFGEVARRVLSWLCAMFFVILFITGVKAQWISSRKTWFLIGRAGNFAFKSGITRVSLDIVSEYAFSIVLLLLVFGLLFNHHFIKQRNNRRLKANQEEIEQKNVFLEKLYANNDKLLKEKKWLIRELHHRVKNNLQLVTSLLYSQSVYVKDDAALLAVKESLRRMHAISLVHQKLYQEEHVSTVEMAEYINDLVHYLHESFDANELIVFKQDVEPLYLDVSQAIPLGLIVTEAVVNALKHAFPNGRRGVVSIDLRRDGDDHLLLKMSDNGVGLPARFESTASHSLGLDLMRGLAKQLNGSFHIETNNGVYITVKFIALTKQFSDKI